MAFDAFGARGVLETSQGKIAVFRLSALEKAGVVVAHSPAGLGEAVLAAINAK